MYEDFAKRWNVVCILEVRCKKELLEVFTKLDLGNNRATADL